MKFFPDNCISKKQKLAEIVVTVPYLVALLVAAPFVLVCFLVLSPLILYDALVHYAEKGRWGD